MSTGRLYVEGNNGGDFLEIVPLDDNLIHLEIGHCCVKSIRAIVPVEFVTAILTNAVLEHNGIKEAMMSVNWPDEFKIELTSQIRKLDHFSNLVKVDNND